jgi:sugar phosphate isomerase/epimerase
MITRRQFLRDCVASASALAATSSNFAAEGIQPLIGCFNRPWSRWGRAETLKGVKTAGYETIGLLTRSKEEPFIGIEAVPAYLEKLKEEIADTGLKANVGSLRSRHNISLEESIK